MNNEQFRKLIAANSAKSGAKDGPSPSSSTPSGATLGSRQRANIPMTPRSIGGSSTQASFARQLAERNQETRARKFKTSTPRGSKLGDGYVDRVRSRLEATEDDRAERLKALEEAVKKEEIDQATFEKLRFQIAGGDLESTHLVKGLDFKLLERIRRGEDVYGEKKADVEKDAEEPEENDVDDEFDQLEGREVQAVIKKKEEKKGQLSTVTLAPGKKRTRNQILQDFKAAREAAKAQQEPALGDRFRKIGAKQMPGSRIERDSKGREVLIIVDEDGHEKRKVRKLQPGEEADDPRNGLLMPDKNVKPLGMEAPEQYRKKEEPPEQDVDVDIFDDVGDDYDPLAGMDGSDSDSEDEGEAEGEAEGTKADKEGSPTDAAKGTTAMPPPPPLKPAAAAEPRNYFQGSKTGLVSEEETKAPSMSDPAIVAAIKRAAALNPIGKEDSAEAKEAKALEERRKKMLSNSNRDDDDMDMGFGTSRFEDEEDFEDKKIKLSVWGRDDGDEGGTSKGGGQKRKRGGKKRKGDANNAADVLRVMEQRKKAS